ncbi:MAG: alpha/beta fold hydrolase [Solirubrobacterales bacterium]
MAPRSPKDSLAQQAEQTLASLPSRYLGCGEDQEATFQLIMGDIGRRWEVQVSRARCVVRPTPTRRADVVIGTDVRTWLDLRAGRTSSVQAVTDRKLYARGNLDLAIAFEGMFRLPEDRPPRVRLHDVRIEGGARIRTITAGSGDRRVILLHGLGSSKVSFIETIAHLEPHYRVHAIDLPGFGSSSKDRAPHDAPYFARSVGRFMDTLAIDQAHLVGNSMGGRVALEVALSTPGRVSSLGLLCPAVAFIRNREFAPLVKLLRPELAAIPHPMLESVVRRQLLSLFARPERLDPAMADIATDEFLRVYRSRSARVAFASAARQIYLDPPQGRDGLWTRLAGLERPALFVWGSHDTLIPAGFARHVERVLPHARQVTFDDCGHVPQIEHPRQTNGLLHSFMSRVDTEARRGHEPVQRLRRVA